MRRSRLSPPTRDSQSAGADHHTLLLGGEQRLAVLRADLKALVLDFYHFGT